MSLIMKMKGKNKFSKKDFQLRKTASSLLGEERGAVLVLLALAMVFLLGITSLAIDVGAQGVEKRKMVTAADAAALAGGQFLPESPSLAREAAKEYAAYHGYQLSDDDIYFENENRRIVVTIPAAEVGYFSKFFQTARKVKASAAAEKVAGGFWRLNPGIITFKDDGELQLKGNLLLGASGGHNKILLHSNGKMEVKDSVVKLGDLEVYGTAKLSIEDKTGGFFSSRQTGIVHQPPLTQAQLDAFKEQAIALGQYYTSKVNISGSQSRHWTGVVYIDKTATGQLNKLELEGTITGGALIIVDGKVELKGNARLEGALYVLGSNGIEFKESCNVVATGAIMSLEKIEFKDSGTVTVNYDDSFIFNAGLAALTLVQ